MRHAVCHAASNAHVVPGVSDAIDVYDSTTGFWSTNRLSQARDNPVALSIGNFALVAGGDTGRGEIATHVMVLLLALLLGCLCR